MRRIILILNLVLLLVLVSLPALGEELNVTAYVNMNQIRLGQSVTLTVEIVGISDIPEPQVEVADCQVKYNGPSTMVSIVNGKSSRLIRHVYTLIPQKSGTITIPKVEVKWQGRSYYTDPIKLNVSTGNASTTEQTLEEKLQQSVFMEVDIAKTRAYVNEQIPITINLYYNDSVELQNIHYPELNLNNFLAGEYDKPREQMVTRDGKYYHVIPFKTSIQPVSKGKYNLGSITLSVDIAIPRESNRSNSFFNSFFEPNFDLVPVNLTSDQVSVEILDFPTLNKPEDFQGAVGRFDLEVNVSPKQVKPGEPITIRSRVTGVGNFNTVNEPLIETLPQFKYYEPQLVNDSSANQNQQVQEKVFEQVIIPLEQLDSLPTISFSYFDPALEKYQTIRKTDLPVQILPGENLTSQVADYTENPKTNLLGQDILYIKGSIGGIVAVGQLVKPVFGLLNLVILGILLCSLIIKWWITRENPVVKRRKTVTANVLKLLKELETLAIAGENVQFYNQLYQTMQNYLKEYYQITITGISEYETTHLLKAGMSPQLVEQIQKFYTEIDAKRFAGYFSSKDEMEELLSNAQEIVNQVSVGEVA